MNFSFQIFTNINPLDQFRPTYTKSIITESNYLFNFLISKGYMAHETLLHILLSPLISYSVV